MILSSGNNKKAGEIYNGFLSLPVLASSILFNDNFFVSFIERDKEWQEEIVPSQKVKGNP